MSSADKIMHLNPLLEQVAAWKAEGHKIVFTNGCFDILHLGHIDYLEKSKALGSKLVVAINTDASVKRLKGNSRPINNEDSRTRMMAALAFTDAVVLFDEPTPLQMIEQVVPDILVKGDDYHVGNIVGADFVISQGGEVKTIELVKGYSTSTIIDKIKNLKQ